MGFQMHHVPSKLSVFKVSKSRWMNPLRVDSFVQIFKSWSSRSSFEGLNLSYWQIFRLVLFSVIFAARLINSISNFVISVYIWCITIEKCHEHCCRICPNVAKTSMCSNKKCLQNTSPMKLQSFWANETNRRKIKQLIKWLKQRTIIHRNYYSIQTNEFWVHIIMTVMQVDF